MRAGRRNINTGKHYDYLFPTVKGEFVTIKSYANLADTTDLMQKVINETRIDTSILAPLLQADTLKQTCRNIWKFCFKHLQYRRDQQGKEQVRRPARSWKDRIEGVDCDCMTVFISSILVNLGIPYTIRLTKDRSPEFEHVYPVVKTDKETIILDCVVHEFNREAPYRDKKDIDMELQYLNGVDDGSYDDEYIGDEDIVEEFMDADYPEDAQQLAVDEILYGLEGKAQRQARKAKRKEKRAEFKKLPLKERMKEGFKKVMNVANKLNPAAALMRVGLLASMKLNIGKVARKLRFAYWDEATAIRNNMDINKYHDLIKVKDKLETIFFGAGGKKENLRKAILTGKGNKDKQVQLNGLGSVTDDVSDHDDLKDILGEDIYNDEVSDPQVEGLGVVTAAATGAAVTAAAGVIASIVSLLKKVGGAFKKNTPQAQAEAVNDQADDAEETTRKFSVAKLMNMPIVQKLKNGLTLQTQSNTALLVDPTPADTYSDSIQRTPDTQPDSSQTQPDTTADTPADDTKDPNSNEDKGFVAWVKRNKWWVIGGSAATLLIGGFFVNKHLKKKKSLNGVEGLDGVDGVDGVARKKPRRKKPVKKQPKYSATKKQKTRKKPTTGARSGRRMIELG